MTRPSIKDRRSPRVVGPVKLFDVGRQPPEQLFAKNISLGGLYLLTTRRAVGENLELVLEHREKKGRVLGRVTHNQADGVGVAFVKPTPAFLELVQGIIDDLVAGGDAAARQAGASEVMWADGERRREGKLASLGPHAAVVEAQDLPEIGAMLYFYLPGYVYAPGTPRPSEARGCAARVVSHGESSFGVEFVEPSAEFQMAITSMLERRTGSGAEATAPARHPR